MTVTSALAPFAGWTPAELARRRTALEQVMVRAGLEHAVLWGAQRSGSAVAWLTQWPVTREAHVLVTRGEPDVLLVGFANHVPQARRVAVDADVRDAGHRPAETVAALLRARGAAGSPVGLVGALPWDQHAVLADGRRVVDLGADYTGLRLRKSAEEVQALRHAAALTDLAAGALLEDVVGCTEHELLARTEAAYVRLGGLHHIHYLSVTPMAHPERSVPAQWPSARRVQPGDVLTFELSAAVAPDHAGQLLRTAAVAEQPSADVQRLHDVATAAYDAVVAKLRPGSSAQELLDAGRVVQDAGLKLVDDLVHGFGGGYLPPVLGPRTRVAPDFLLEVGMTLVVQPNVVLPDDTLGVQTGELLLVTDDGPERLHAFPAGLVVLP